MKKCMKSIGVKCAVLVLGFVVSLFFASSNAYAARQIYASDVDIDSVPGKTVDDVFDGGYDVTVKAEDIVTKGPWVDAGAYASFSAAIDAIGSAKRTLLIPDIQSVTASKAVPTNVALWFFEGGKLDISAGATVTVKGAINAPLTQIFDGSGTVEFEAGAVEEIYPEWWGIDGVADDVQINTAIDSANAIEGGRGGHVKLSQVYVIANTVHVKSNVRISGNGNASQLIGADSFAGPVMDIGTATSEYTKVELENFTVDIGSAASNSVGIDKISCKRFTMKNVRILAQKFSSNTQIGLRFQNGTHNYIEDLRVEGGQIAIRMINPVNNECHDTVWNKVYLAPMAIAGSYGIYATGGKNGSTWIQPYFETNSSGNTTGIYTEDGVYNWAIVRPRWDGTFAKTINNLSGATRMTLLGSGDPDYPGSQYTNVLRCNFVSERMTQLQERFRVINAGGNVAFQYDANGLVVGPNGSPVIRIMGGNASWDPDSLADGASATRTVSVPDVDPGDAMSVGFSSITTGGWQISATRTAAATVTVTITNHTGGTVDLPWGTVEVVVIQLGI